MENGMSASWRSDLDGPAFEVASALQSPLRVDAGPGTGKTFALMRRVWRLLEEGCDPTRIFVGTFTRTAATDLKTSLAKLGVAGAETVQAGTIHAFCYGLLSREVVLEQTGRITRPLLKFEDRFLLEDLNRNIFGGIRDRRRRLDAFNAAWARLQSDEPGWPHDDVDQRFHDDLISWFRFHEAMHIGEFVPLTLHYLRENPASELRSAFDHVLVDEYQDLNKAEQVLLDLLAASGTLTVVGDEDQSIYSFRYAHPDGIKDFSIDRPHTHSVSMLQCRRCPKHVVEMANVFIARNQLRSPRELGVLEGNPDGEIHVVQWNTMQDEAQGLTQFIKRRIEAGEVDAGKVLVLSPRRQFGYAIRDALNGIDIPAHSFFFEEELDGDPSRPDRCQAQEAFSLLTLLASPADAVALRCWCGFRNGSLMRGPWARLREYCEHEGLSPWEALQRLCVGDIAIPVAGQLVPRFQALDARLAELRPLRGHDLVDALFPPGDDWADGLRTLARNQANDGCNPTRLREALRTAIAQPELPTDVEYVRVMSLHKSKGLTADMVVVAGCIEGCIPRVPEDIPIIEQVRVREEQRRLFYVAITRTSRILLLSSVTRLPIDVAHRMRVPVHRRDHAFARTIASSFLTELGPRRPDTILGDSIL